jgi:hypothetical protein
MAVHTESEFCSAGWVHMTSFPRNSNDVDNALDGMIDGERQEEKTRDTRFVESMPLF